MPRQTGATTAALASAGLAATGVAAFVAAGPRTAAAPTVSTVQAPARFLASTEAPAGSGLGLGSLAAVVGLGAVAAGAAAAKRPAKASKATVVSLASSVAPASCETFFRDQLVARCAQEGHQATVEETDRHMEGLEAIARQMVAGAAGVAVFTGSMMEAAEAYPIFAQQNYPNPREANGRLACANCHLASKPVDVRMPHDVLPDTIFKASIEIPAKYEKRMQPIADGTKGPMNVGAIAIMPEGWKLAPKDRLPKALKKEMKGLAWAPYSKEKPNIVVAGPVPGQRYEEMTLPILAPTVDYKNIYYGGVTMYFGGNRGRGQVYPEGNQSNNNQFFAPCSGTVTAIDGLKITIQKEDGTTEVKEVLPAAQIVVEVGEQVKKDDPLTTNPNVGGFGQEEKEVVLQDMNRIYAYVALGTSLFLSQLVFVLKKKQFEKVQLAEGF